MSLSTTLWAGRLPSGFLALRGRDALDLMHRLSTNDLRPLAQAGRKSTTVFTNEKGRIVDWVDVLSLASELVVRTSEGRAKKLAEWLDRFTIMEDVRAVDVSAEYELAVVTGPGAAVAAGWPEVTEAHKVTTRDRAHAWLGHPAYGERIEVLTPVGRATAVIDKAVASGARKADSHIFEQLRILAGVPSPAHEFVEEVNPLELRLNRGVISWDKGCYIGQEVIARMDSYDKLARQLIGFVSPMRINESADMKIVRDGRPLGRVTSIVDTPEGGSVGLAVVKREVTGEGALGGGGAPAELTAEAATFAVNLVDRPFWQPA